MKQKKKERPPSDSPPIHWFYPESPRTIPQPDQVVKSLKRLYQKVWERIPPSAQALISRRLTEIQLISSKPETSGYENGNLFIGVFQYKPEAGEDSEMIFTIAHLLAFCFTDSMQCLSLAGARAAGAGATESRDSAVRSFVRDDDFNERLADALVLAWGFTKEFQAHAGAYGEEDVVKSIPILVRRFASRRRILTATL